MLAAWPIWLGALGQGLAYAVFAPVVLLIFLFDCLEIFAFFAGVARFIARPFGSRPRPQYGRPICPSCNQARLGAWTEKCPHCGFSLLCSRCGAHTQHAPPLVCRHCHQPRACSRCGDVFGPPVHEPCPHCGALNVCPSCGYDLAATSTDRCPECDAPFFPHQLLTRPKRRRWR